MISLVVINFDVVFIEYFFSDKILSISLFKIEKNELFGTFISSFFFSKSLNCSFNIFNESFELCAGALPNINKQFS